MKSPLLVRFYHPDTGERVGVRDGDAVHDISDAIGSVASWLRGSGGRVEDAISDVQAAVARSSHSYPASDFANRPAEAHPHWLPPVDEQDVWAAGVTYTRSREARQVEAVDGGDIYARVYGAKRPELFFKARAPWVVGPYDNVGIRADATWNVPEPELGLVINPALEIVGVVTGNDMSSRDIEGANPLYLPQAKVYNAACALGPGIRLGRVQNEWPAVGIGIVIRRGQGIVFESQTHTDQLHRQPQELVDYLGRCLEFPDGVVLLTGTGIVPPDEFTLKVDDVVEISIEGIGVLQNTVKVV